MTFGATLEESVEKLEAGVEKRGGKRYHRLSLADHGYGGHQHAGTAWIDQNIDPNLLQRIGQCVDEVVLTGCEVGSDPTAVQTIANLIGKPVWASPKPVEFTSWKYYTGYDPSNFIKYTPQSDQSK